jgi:hypothetical protein
VRIRNSILGYCQAKYQIRLSAVMCYLWWCWPMRITQRTSICGQFSAKTTLTVGVNLPPTLQFAPRID